MAGAAGSWRVRVKVNIGAAGECGRGLSLACRPNAASDIAMRHREMWFSTVVRRRSRGKMPLWLQVAVLYAPYRLPLNLY